MKDISIKKLLTATLMLLFIFCSGSVVGIIYAKYFDIVFLALSVAFLAVNKEKIHIRNCITLLIFAGLYILNYTVNFFYAPNIRAYISYMCRLIATGILCSNISKEEFEEYYIDWMAVIALGSVFTFWLIYHTSIDNFTYLNQFKMFAGVFHILQSSRRNCGIFWEPGAFQFFLAFALALSLHRNQWHIRKNMPELVAQAAFVIGILSSKSTSGYLALLCIAGAFLFYNWNSMPAKYKLLMLIPITACGAIVAYKILKSPVITKKFSTNNVSYNIRNRDIYGSIEIIKNELLLIGAGFETTRVSSLYAAQSIKDNSMGLFSTLISMGEIYIVGYLGLMWQKIRRYYKMDLALIALLGISGMTEDFFQYPIYLAWLFAFGASAIKNRTEDITQLQEKSSYPNA